MKNIIAAPIPTVCSTACSLNIATRWALGGLTIAVLVMALLAVTA